MKSWVIEWICVGENDDGNCAYRKSYDDDDDDDNDDNDDNEDHQKNDDEEDEDLYDENYKGPRKVHDLGILWKGINWLHV